MSQAIDFDLAGELQLVVSRPASSTSARGRLHQRRVAGRDIGASLFSYSGFVHRELLGAQR